VCRKEIDAYFEWEPDFLIKDKDGNLIIKEDKKTKEESGIIIENVEEEN
jgi:hypothetical protein